MSISNRSSAAAATARPARSADSIAGSARSRTPERLRFALVSRSSAIDHRIHAARRDLAEIALAGRWFAPHYAAPVRAITGLGGADMLDAWDGRRISQLLPGEPFAVVERSGSWAWGFSEHDHYVGYVMENALSNDCKADRPTVAHGADPVAVAETFLDMPYLWGGRGIGGIDCSGLVQRAYAAIGIALPRDSDQQAALGTMEVPAMLVRGDLLFFPDHVVMMTGPADAIHANGHHMRVVTEPLAEIVARIGSPTGHYRP